MDFIIFLMSFKYDKMLDSYVIFFVLIFFYVFFFIDMIRHAIVIVIFFSFASEGKRKFNYETKLLQDSYSQNEP